MGKQLNQQAARVIGRLVGKSIDLDWLSDPTREEINQRRGKEVEEKGKIRTEGMSCDGSRGPWGSATGGFRGAPWLETVREGRKAGALPNRTK